MSLPEIQPLCPECWAFLRPSPWLSSCAECGWSGDAQVARSVGERVAKLRASATTRNGAKCAAEREAARREEAQP